MFGLFDGELFIVKWSNCADWPWDIQTRAYIVYAEWR